MPEGDRQLRLKKLSGTAHLHIALVYHTEKAITLQGDNLSTALGLVGYDVKATHTKQPFRQHETKIGDGPKKYNCHRTGLTSLPTHLRRTIWTAHEKQCITLSLQQHRSESIYSLKCASKQHTLYVNWDTLAIPFTP